MGFFVPPTMPLAAPGVNGIIDLNTVKVKKLLDVNQSTYVASLPFSNLNLQNYKRVWFEGYIATGNGAAGVELRYSINNNSSVLIAGFANMISQAAAVITCSVVNLYVSLSSGSYGPCFFEFLPEAMATTMGGAFKSSFAQSSTMLTANGYQADGLTSAINAFTLQAFGGGNFILKGTLYGEIA